MQEKQQINLSSKFLRSGADKMSIPSIRKELGEHTTQIASLLTGYHWHEKGIVNSIEIEPESITIDGLRKGSFKVRYGINIHYGCSDVEIDLDKAMVIGIEIDVNAGTVLLIGEHIPEREPDGY